MQAGSASQLGGVIKNKMGRPTSPHSFTRCSPGTLTGTQVVALPADERHACQAQPKKQQGFGLWNVANWQTSLGSGIADLGRCGVV